VCTPPTRRLEIELPAEESRKPTCCDEEGRPPADEDLAASLSDASGVDARPPSAPLTSCPSLVHLLRRTGRTQADPADRRTYCDLRNRTWRNRSPSSLTPCQGEGRGFESRRPLHGNPWPGQGFRAFDLVFRIFGRPSRSPGPSRAVGCRDGLYPPLLARIVPSRQAYPLSHAGVARRILEPPRCTSTSPAHPTIPPDLRAYTNIESADNDAPSGGNQTACGSRYLTRWSAPRRRVRKSTRTISPCTSPEVLGSGSARGRDFGGAASAVEPAVPDTAVRDYPSGIRILARVRSGLSQWYSDTRTGPL
jgi:hypothetical protein